MADWCVVPLLGLVMPPKTEVRPWADKIKSLSWEDPKSLLANPDNWRVHPNDQREKLRGVIDEIGFIDPVLQNDVTGHLINGHARTEEALERGMDQIAVIHIDLSENEERIAIATFDPISGLAITNSEILKKLIGGITTSSQAVSGLLASMMALQPSLPTVTASPDPQFGRAGELRTEWGTETGQLWEIESRSVLGGSHRVFVGDCMNRDHRIQLLQESPLVGFVFADPPYGIALDTGASARRRAHNGAKSTSIDETNAPWDSVLAFDWITPWVKEISGAGYLASWTPFQGIEHVARLATEAGLIWLNLFTWVKQNPVPGFPEYLAKSCEHCAIFRAPGAGRYVGREIVHDYALTPLTPQSERIAGHPAVKRLDVIEPIIAKLLKVGGIVADPFLGSGSTMVAAENMGRLCYGMEIDPIFAAVALQRMKDMGLKPRRR
jgi:DNA modification methylase